MLIAAALLALSLGPGALDAPGGPSQQAAQPAPRQGSGIVIAADIEGRLAIYDGERRLVMELDKPAGRSLQVSLEPGPYEARLAGTGARVRFLVSDGQPLVLSMDRFEDAPPPPGAGPTAGERRGVLAPPLDGRHRVEMRVGGWGDGWYGRWDHGDATGTGQAAFGVEYLDFVRNDIGIGIAVTGLARGTGRWNDWHDSGTAQALLAVPIGVRWYPLRRATTWRALEPYVTAGVGPVFALSAHHWDGFGSWDESTAHVAAAFGGRAGGGVDVRIGPVFTIGLAGAWNWDTGFSGTEWQAYRPRHGEFTLTLGWHFGR